LFLDYCRDGLLELAKEIYEKQDTNEKKKELLKKRDIHDNRNCLHTVMQFIFDFIDGFVWA